MNGPLGAGGTPKKASVREGPPANEGAGDVAEAVGVPGGGAETEAGVGVPEAKLDEVPVFLAGPEVLE